MALVFCCFNKILPIFASERVYVNEICGFMVEKRVFVVDGALFRCGKVLLGKRPITKSFLPGYWELPGGHEEMGETPETALKREFLEELGIEIRVLRQIHEFSFFSAGISKKLLCFLVEQVDSSEPKALDHDELRWITEEDLSGLLISRDELASVRIGFREMRRS